MSSVEQAIRLALDAHHGQVDKNGAPYILHPLRLMSRFYDDPTRIVAVLHDVVEDSDYTLADLRFRGYSEDIVHAVDCLTKREDEDYMRHIQRTLANPLAVRVKIADLEDNMDIRRYPPNPTEKDLERLQRYRQAWEYLQTSNVK